MSHPPYVPPEDVCNTKSKKNSKWSGKKSADNAEHGEEDGMVGALDDGMMHTWVGQKVMPITLISLLVRVDIATLRRAH